MHQLCTFFNIRAFSSRKGERLQRLVAASLFTGYAELGGGFIREGVRRRLHYIVCPQLLPRNMYVYHCWLRITPGERRDECRTV